MNEATHTKKDIPLPLALVLLAIVLGFIYSNGSLKNIEMLINSVEKFGIANQFLLNCSGLALLINIVSIYVLYRKLISLKRQGSRLRVLRKEKKLITVRGTVKIISVLLTTIVALFATKSFFSHLIVGKLPKIPFDDFLSVMSGNIAVACGTFGWLLIAAIEFICSKLKKRKKISEFPKDKNQICIGETKSDLPNIERSWETMGRKALNGNILVTGSIGSGKTQGIILPFFEQLLTNFDPRPAILAIDPKGTFVKEALQIAKAHGLEKEVLHVSLDNDVTFNPIFVKDALKRATFLDIAQMIRASARNFMGDSQEAAFWEISAFNLIKNCLCYSAAVHHYYTLNTLYDVVIEASRGNLSTRLVEAVNKQNFDLEEKFNIERAIKYFSLEFAELDPKIKTGILATATSFLNQFQEFRAGKVFCPAEDKLTISSMDEAIDQGKIILFDIVSPGLARSTGTLFKLHFESSLLNRLSSSSRGKARPGVLVIDEYQDVATTGGGVTLGDDRFLAKGREANSVMIAATQSLTSLESSIGKEKAARELFQNFRTRIACHSTDPSTIKLFQELAGEEEREKISRSLSELAQDAKRNYLFGGFDAENANITESFNVSKEKEHLFSVKDFSTLRPFEALGQVYDGKNTKYKRIFLKPYFLKEKAISHEKLLSGLTTIVAALFISFSSPEAKAVPSICDVVNTSFFEDCFSFQQGSCMCGGFPPRPCASFSYYVPRLFIEVHPNAGETMFRGLPGTTVQLNSLTTLPVPYGAEADFDTYSYHAHTISIPWADLAFKTLPCTSGLSNPLCFGAMSEHLGRNWLTGEADMRQPLFLAWAAAPKPCLLKGAAMSLAGGGETLFRSGSPMCSMNLPDIKVYPPSSHSVCNGWGVFFPRYGTYTGESQTIGALMIAARIKSLASEVFQSAPSSPDEKWQMISPGASACFREGENASSLESWRLVTEKNRIIKGKLRGYLFAIYQRVGCCADLHNIARARAALAAMKAACTGKGSL